MTGRGSDRPRFRVLAAALLLLSALLVSAGNRVGAARPGAAPLAPLPPAQRDVVYCTGGGLPLAMDLYAPAQWVGAPQPAILFVHGGGWTGGDKASDEGAPETADLVKRGYLVASINYRLAPQFIFPAPIEDVKCAVRFLRANAGRFHLDPNRIGAWGASAGGHLVSLLGTTGGLAAFEGAGGYADQSSRVQAVVDMYGRADLTGIPATRPDLVPIFGAANLVAYSPVTYASPDDPPFLILHGDRDSTVPPALSQEFYERLKAAGVPVTLIMVAHAEHSFVPSDGPISPSRSEITRLVGDFFDRYLGDAAPARAAARGGAVPLPAGGESLFCPPTGQTIRSLFLDYWRSHGGLDQIGYPISAELQATSADGRAVTVQYFERAVLEYHPENQPPYTVLPARLGARRYAARYPNGASGQRPNQEAGSVAFEQTGHRLGGWFLDYWQAHGGVAQQGYPISDEFTEWSDLDGQPYTVQYFERAVFELHPENVGTPYGVLLSRLGTLAFGR
jgi:acetyl esterase/lipase